MKDQKSSKISDLFRCESDDFSFGIDAKCDTMNASANFIAKNIQNGGCYEANESDLAF